MTDFLLELRCEEIPARMQDKAREDLARLFTERAGRGRAEGGAKLSPYATPRRLALIAKACRWKRMRSAKEQGPAKVGAPPQALEGFLRKTGLTQDQLEDRDGVWFAARIEKPGRATADVLAEAIPAIIRAFPWPKSSAGARPRPAPRACAGCARCRASSRCWVMMWCRARLTASSAAPPRWATVSIPFGRRHHRQCGRLCDEAARRACHRRSGRAPPYHP
jgi:hypothetical protein